MNAIADFLTIIHDELGLQVTREDADKHLDQVAGRESVQLLMLLTALERETGHIAPSGLTFYQGKLFPQWKNSVFVGGLRAQLLDRLTISGDKVINEEPLLVDEHSRIFRDVRIGPEGAVYVLTDSGRLLRLLPAQGSCQRRFHNDDQRPHHRCAHGLHSLRDQRARERLEFRQVRRLRKHHRAVGDVSSSE